ncbi:MAG TPA: ATP-binding protein, partial [Aquabacterium sp.]|nr:ATP-binding protein [Aquabacterium sp.]
LSNAVKYNKHGGRVDLSVEVAANRVVFKIADTGIGFTADQLRHLYEPFNRLGQELSPTPGTGIGLLITERLVKLMGGVLNVTSAPHEGTTFSFDLPLAQTIPSSNSISPVKLSNPSDTHYGQRHVLYVEDNPINCEIMAAILSYRPQIDLHYAHALSEAKARLDGDSVDLILLDMQLPDGSGMELLEWMQAQPMYRPVPVVMVSADASDESMRASIASGARGYLKKPVDVAETLGILDELLQTRAQNKTGA